MNPIATLVAALMVIGCANSAIIKEEPAPVANSPAIVSQDGLALVKFDGYLSFVSQAYGESLSYLTLKLDSVTRNPFPNPEMKGNNLDLKTDNAVVSMNIAGELPGRTERVWNLKIGQIKSGIAPLECSTLGLNWVAGKHFRCNAPRQFGCFDKFGALVAHLNVHSIEMETNGDSTKHAEGQFSTEPADCL